MSVIIIVIISKFCIIKVLHIENSTNTKSGSRHNANEPFISFLSAFIVSILNSSIIKGDNIQKLNRLEMKRSK